MSLDSLFSSLECVECGADENLLMHNKSKKPYCEDCANEEYELAVEEEEDLKSTYRALDKERL